MSRLIAFWSPSRAGASTLLLNTLAALGARRSAVAAADLNLTTPTLALAADLLPHEAPQSACLSRLLPLLEQGSLTPADLTRSLLWGSGFALLPGFVDVIAASRMTEAYVLRLLDLLHCRFDLVLADVPPAMDSVACLPVLEQADLIYLVAGPTIASRYHTRRFVLAARRLGLEPRLRLLLNRSTAAQAARAQEDIELKAAAVIPFVPLMDRMADAGQLAYLAPVVHPSLNRFRTVMDELSGKVTSLQGHSAESAM